MGLRLSTTTAANNLIPRTICTEIHVHHVFTSDLKMTYNTNISKGGIYDGDAASYNSPLYHAVQRKDLESVVNMLSNKLAKEDEILLSKGKSIVRVAIEHNDQEMLETILKHRPELIKRIDEGLTPLSFAASKGLVNIASYMIKNYTKSISYRNNDKSYPIHKACQGGHVGIIKILHDKNRESLRSTDKDGQTIMHLAAKARGNKLKDVVSYLLDFKEGRELLKKKDENGFIPMQLAINNRNRDVEDIIKSAMSL